MEAMVEAVVSLTHCDPDLTANMFVSLDLIEHLGLVVHALDATPLTSTETAP